MRHNRSLWVGAGVVVLAMTAGCASMKHKKVVTEPPLLSDVSGESVIIEAPVARPVTAADRHPLLRRPREYYDKTNGNKFSKTAAAAVIGVPSGLAGEVRQIFVGQPPLN